MTEQAIRTRPQRRETSDPTHVASMSMVVSGVRCLLAYIVFPWVLPAAGRAGNVGPSIGLVVGLVAIGFNIASISRFQRSTVRWRRHIMALNSAVIALLVVLVVQDVAELLG